MKSLINRNPLFLIFLIPIVVDVVGAVLGQPAEYWQSGGEVFHEVVPFIYLLLQIHPLLFITVCLSLWLPFTYWLTIKLKEPYNLWATMSLLVGHGYNSVTWLRKSLYQAGVFAGEDQLSQALSLIPMTLYILLVGWIAAQGLIIHFENTRTSRF